MEDLIVIILLILIVIILIVWLRLIQMDRDYYQKNCQAMLLKKKNIQSQLDDKNSFANRQINRLQSENEKLRDMLKNYRAGYLNLNQEHDDI